MSDVVARRAEGWGPRGLLWALAPVLLAVPLLLAPLRAPVAGSDEGLLLVHPDSVARGQVAHRDFATVYGPMTYWVLAAAYRVFGDDLVVERSVGVAYRVVIALAVVLLLRRCVPPVAASSAGLASVVLASVHAPLAYAYHGAVAAVLTGLVLLTSDRTVARALGGVAIGLAASFRPEMGLLGLAAVPLLRGRALGPPVLGWVLGLAPLVGHLVVGGRSVLDDVVLGRAGVNSQVRPLSALLVSAAVVLVGVAALLWLHGRRAGDPAVRALGVLGVLLVPNMVQRLDIPHVMWPASVVLAAGTAVLVARVPWLRAGPLRWVPGLSAAGLAAVLGVPALLQAAPVVHHDGRSIHVAPAQVGPVQQVLRTVDEVSGPSDVVFVGAQDLSQPVLPSSWLYHLLPAHPRPFRYEEFLPGRTEQHGSGLVEDLRASDVLVLEDLDELGTRLAPYVPRGPEAANDVVRREFRPVARHGDTLVLVRRDR
ncbi:hypothetical protein [Phycicoccus avicenniae]|uniref:hypothetical protein n=1 Tax=Phycicoccus avicenniae TaxID=2828860 RepID=UPI003D2B21AE